ncbi:Glycerol-3-phosphate dehydrogenase [NAD(+)] 1, chloroplastic [Capsicum baccatum]|uniref:Glycerol-3-phosphate dehydrogenase [NAD(+)] 1, chloroplastic n=1 Tax=Capsicum baccatum TaxID=33114 RepID=A0A2G2WYZ4_CAPBA|nr:Glycerol-3-phosphate dehydrogenase [NAD(+)] 1, chloroplastic [Capsicum baccatum]
MIELAAIMRIGMREKKALSKVLFLSVKDNTFIESCGVADLIIIYYTCGIGVRGTYVPLLRLEYRLAASLTQLNATFLSSLVWAIPFRLFIPLQQAALGSPPCVSKNQNLESGNSVVTGKELEVGKGPGAPLQTLNKYASLENGDGENNQMDEVPHEIVAAEAVHTTNASNVDKNLNANAPVFKPRNITGSPAKEKSTKVWVTSAFAKENWSQLVTTNQSCQEIPSQTYETTSKEGDKEIEEGEVHDRNVDEHGDD